MPGYHSVFSGLWDDDALEGLPFEAKGFFVFLFTNPRMRPSGIYRATDDQLMADTGLSTDRLRQHLKALADRGRIVRDGSWLFVVGYLKRQPKHEKMMTGARRDVEQCSSRVILEAFAARYPLLSRWSTDRLKTISELVLQNSLLTPTPYSLLLTPTPKEPSADRQESIAPGRPEGPGASPEPNPEDCERIAREARALKQRFAPYAAHDVMPPRELKL